MKKNHSKELDTFSKFHPSAWLAQTGPLQILTFYIFKMLRWVLVHKKKVTPLTKMDLSFSDAPAL